MGSMLTEDGQPVLILATTSAERQFWADREGHPGAMVYSDLQAKSMQRPLVLVTPGAQAEHDIRQVQQAAQRNGGTVRLLPHDEDPQQAEMPPRG